MLKLLLATISALALVACAFNKSRTNQSEIDPSSPKLLKPLVKKIWIPPEIRNGGNEWTEGHYLYRIERTTTWSR